MPNPQASLATPLLLDRIHEHVAAHPSQVFLTQPVGAGQVIDYTWAEVLDQARRMAAHLKSFGFAPGARFAMLAKNSAHFFMAELAIWMAGGTTVAIFPTETAANVRYVLDHSEASLLFVGRLDTWEQQKAAVPDGLPCIALPLAPVLNESTNVKRWDDIIASTAPLGGLPIRAADDIAMLLYTSGSTGQPKGVMHSFATASSAVNGILRHREDLEGLEPSRVLSYLPLAHAYERSVVMCLSLMHGNTHIFFSESLATFMDDLRRARPTLFVSVPRLWAKFQQAVLAQMPAAQLDAMLDNPAMAAAVGKKVLASLGLDAVTQASSGSAPITAQLMNWYRRLGLNLLEGYAMTEDFCYSHRSSSAAKALGHVGKPYPEVQARIAEDGEILVKSPACMVGYYKQPELNAESFTEDGFFRTGDLGHYNADGLLKLTGRKKELFKTAKGKYVAPAPIENLLNVNPMVELSLVSGLGQPAAFALVQLDESLRPKLGQAEVRASVTAALKQLRQDVNAQLASHEHLQFIAVSGELWSMDNGCLTPTMKIKRNRIEAGFADVLTAWYASGDDVIWA